MLLDERYKLYERLGEGGMAEVFRAEDLRLGREVAVKILRPQYASEKSFLERFINEARSMAGFSHPNVVNVYDVGRDGQRYYIVMEYVPGEDLRQQLERNGSVPARQALDIARQMAQGIGYAHRKGLVHRDIKPGNILMTPLGEVKVADFGIAKAMASVGLTEPGIVWGTTAYLSPEQVRGEPATPASDVYAMGVVLYEMLAGKPPFQGEDRVSIALKHLRDEPPPFDEAVQMARGVEFLVRKALAKEPRERFANAEEMARSLGEYLRAGADATVARPIVAPAEATIVPPANGRRSARPDATTVGPSNQAATPSAAREAAAELRAQRAVRRRAAGTEPPVSRPASREGSPQVAQRRVGVDWGTVLVGIVAALLLSGLIPWWMYVLSIVRE